MKKQNRLSFLVALTFAITGAAAAQTILFEDNFNSPPLDVTTKWRRGNNSSGVTIPTNSNYLQLISQSGQNGWIVTQQAFPGNNTSVTLKILQPNLDGDIGICPTLPALTNQLGIYNEPNFYRFYINQDNAQTPPRYQLFACKRKSGGSQICDEAAQLTLSANYGTPLYLRMRLSEGVIFFEYSFDGCFWSMMHFEPFDLPGYTTSNSFYYEIASNNTPVNGIFQVDDFKIESYPATSYASQPTILNDPLNSSTFNSSGNPGVIRKNIGGSFTATGWKPSSSQPNADMVYYDLGRYLENGSLEIDVNKFYPTDQNNPDFINIPRHHVLAMFRQPWGGHHSVENLDTFWDLHTGTAYSGGVKFMSNTYYTCDEFATVITNAQKPWDPNKNTTYHLKIVWDNRSLKYYRDGQLHSWHILQNSMQLRYIYVGRDSTVSGDKVTGFLHNQYPTMSDATGPIYSNLVVKEFRLSETTPPGINSIAVSNLYQNAARLSWSTGETAVCYVKYGTTTAYGQTTGVLGPPATTFTTLLANLNPGTLYHYRVVAEDEAGNVAQSTDRTFTTTTNSAYAFKPVADTYIEADDRENRDNPDPADYPWLYGKTRAEGNYGWMNLMTAEKRDAFLQFNVTGVTGTITQATLRLYGRQTSVTGANVRQFTPLQSNWEMNATWTDANTNHQYLDRSVYSSAPLLGSISSTTAGQWHSVDVSAATGDANNNYYFVLQGTGAPTDENGILAKVNCGSFDSHESTNNQPELIVSTGIILVSNSVNATALNNSRKLVRDSSGKYHLVYESDGEIYYQYSTNGVDNWLGQIQLSAGNGNNLYPCITERDGRIYVVWQRFDGTYYDVYFRKSTNGGASWSSINQVGFDSNVSTVHPVIISPATGKLTLVFRGSSNLRYRISDDDGANWTTGAQVPNTGTNAYSPTLAPTTTYGGSSSRSALVYASTATAAGAIYYRYYMNGPDSTGWNANARNLAAIVPGSYTGHQKPSIAPSGTSGYTRLHAAWEAALASNGERLIIHRKATDWGNWSSVYSVLSYLLNQPQLPSITGLTNDSAELLLQGFDLNNIYKRHFDGSTWAGTSFIGAGTNPSVSVGNTSAKYVWSYSSANPAGNVPPYQIKTSTETLSKTSSQLAEVYHRSIAVLDTVAGAWLEVRLDKLAVKTKTGEEFAIPFGEAKEDANTLTPANAFSNLASSQVNLPAEAESLFVDYSVNGQGLSKIRNAGIAINVELAISGKQAMRLPVINTTSEALPNTKRLLVVRVAGGELSLRTHVAGIANKPGLIASLGHIYEVVETPLPKTLEEVAGTATPQDLVLEAYPNPFNPSTQIRFAMKEAGRAKLCIYNLNGQLIRELLNEHREPGEHTVPWDGRDDRGAAAASGVYFFRFEAGHAVKISRVMLVR